MKRTQAVKTALVLAVSLAALTISAAAFTHLPDPGFSVPVPDGWRAGRGDLLRPAIGESADAGVVTEERDSDVQTVIVEGEEEPEGEVRLFLLSGLGR